MNVIPPLTITDAMLTSSTVTDTYPTTAWSGASTYAVNDITYIAGAALLRTAYKSLAGSNTNNAPASSPTWWVKIGDVYPVYAGGTTYADGDIVQDSAAHLIYESLVGSNTGNALSDRTKWYPVGASSPDARVFTNKWAMFDTFRNTQTVMGSPMTVVVTPGVRVDSIALLGLLGNSATISVASGGPTVYSETVDLNTREVLDWHDYFFKAFSTSPSLALFNLPPYTNAVITVTITATSGDVKCGAMVIGSKVFAGDVDYGAVSDVLNFSTVTRDPATGESTLNAVPNVPKTVQNIWLDKSRVNSVRALRNALNGLPAVWSGLDDSDHEYFESLLILGIYKRFSIGLNHPTLAKIDLELEEV